MGSVYKNAFGRKEETSVDWKKFRNDLLPDKDQAFYDVLFCTALSISQRSSDDDQESVKVCLRSLCAYIYIPVIIMMIGKHGR